MLHFEEHARAAKSCDAVSVPFVQSFEALVFHVQETAVLERLLGKAVQSTACLSNELWDEGMPE